MANRYWVGGTGTWDTSSTTNWSTTSGGAGGASAPTSVDNVIFDAGSDAGGIFTVTVNNNASCNDLTAGSLDYTMTFNFGGYNNLYIYGSLLFPATNFTVALQDVATFIFSSTSTGKTITTNGKQIGAAIQFNGVGGGWTLGSDLSFGSISVTAGTFNTGNYNLTSIGGRPDFSSTGSAVRAINLGSSTFLTNGMNISGSNLTFNAGTSQINLGATNSWGVGLPLTFYNFTMLGPMAPQSSNILNLAHTFNNLTLTAPTSAGTSVVSLSANITINGTFSITGGGGTAANRILVNSDVGGTRRTITCNAISNFTSGDFQDIAIAGAVSPWAAPFGVGNLGNNTGITFNSSTAYWIGGTGNWTDSTHWSLSSGGSAVSGGIPQSTNSVVFDANSDSGAIFTVYVSNNKCNDFTASNLDFEMTFYGVSTTIGIYGSLITPATKFVWWIDATTTTTFYATSTGKTITLRGVKNGGCALNFNGVGGGWTLGNALEATAITLTNGTLDTSSSGNYGITSTIGLGVGTKGLNLNGSTWSVGSTLDFSTNSTGFTFNCGTSTIDAYSFYSNGFNGGPFTFYNYSFNYNGGAADGSGIVLRIYSATTFNNFSIKAPYQGIEAIEFSANVIINGTFSITSSNTARDRLVFRSSVVATTRTLKVASASLSNVDFRDITIDPTSGTYPLTGTSFGNAGNNSGITFTTPKTVYWNLAGTQSWLSTGWATTNTGTPAANNFPLAQDTAVFTEAGAAGTIVFSSDSRGLNLPAINCADGVSNRVTAFTLAFGGASGWYFNGDITGFKNLVVTADGSNGFVFQKQGTQTIIMNGGNFTGFNGTSISPGTNLTLGGDCTLAGISVSTGGTLTTNNKTFTSTSGMSVYGTVNSNTSGAINLTGTGTVWSASGATITGNGQIIISTTSGAVTFAGGNISTYPKLTLGDGTGSKAQVTITGSNAFNEISSNRFGGYLLLTAGTSQQVNNFTYAGYKDTIYNVAYAGLNSTSSTPANLVKSGGSTVNVNYLDVSYVNVTPTNTWYALNSLSRIGSNTGWIFSGYSGNYGYTDAGNPIENKYVTKDYVMDYYPDLIPGAKAPMLSTWGANSYGNLGDGTTTSRSSPSSTLANTANWKQIALASSFAIALKTDGSLWSWGDNAFGMLADGTATARSSPGSIAGGGTTWKQVSAAYCQWGAVKTDGTLWTCGYNWNGALGRTTGTGSSPITVDGGGTTWKQITCGYRCMLAIKTDGSMWGWGQNANGEIGDGTTSSRLSPVSNVGGNSWSKVSLGTWTAGAIKTDGTLWTWGFNGGGQLGDNTTSNRSSPVTTAGGGNNWKFVAAGQYLMSAIKTDGTLWTWGYNSYGALGDGTTTGRSSPGTTFSGGNNWKQTSAGQTGNYFEGMMAIKTDGTLWAWGINNYGRLGDGTTSTRSVPVQISGGGTNWKQVSCAYGYGAAISEAQGW